MNYATTIDQRPIQQQRRAPARQRKHSMPLVLLGFFFVIAIPYTVGFSPGGVLLTPYRLFMIATFPLIAIKFASRPERLSLADYFLFGYSAWAIMCICINYTAAGAVERGGQLFMEVTCAYLLARAYIRTLPDALAAFNALFIVIALSTLFAIPEAITHTRPVIEIPSRISGIPSTYYAEGTDVRMGLRRAQGLFQNPIVAGLICSTLISMVWYTERKAIARWIKLVIVLAGTFISLSSTPLLGLAAHLMLLIQERITRPIKSRLTIGLGLIAIIMLLLEIFTESGPVGILINYFSFNKISSYNRITIWNHGWENILAHPFFGMIPETWVRPAWMKVSIDNFWVYNGLLSGIPGQFMMGGALVSGIWLMLAIRKPDLPENYFRFRTGWVFTMAVLGLSGFCITFYDKLQPIYYFILGTGVALLPEFRRVARDHRQTRLRRRLAPAVRDDQPVQS